MFVNCLQVNMKLCLLFPNINGQLIKQSSLANFRLNIKKDLYDRTRIETVSSTQLS